MSRKYKDSKDVPTTVLCARLDELWKAVTGGRDSIAREFYMRVPTEVDNDADIVICEASRRLTRLEAENAQLKERIETLEALIFAHNSECEFMCNPEVCGYDKYPNRLCATCPKDWKIERPPQQEEEK